MLRFLLAAISCSSALLGVVTAQEKQVLELRPYTLEDAAGEQKLDQYLQHALMPALVRQGLGPIGVFDQTEPSAEELANQKGKRPIEVMLLIPGKNAEAVVEAAAKLAGDTEYQKAAQDYLSTPADQPFVKRIRSELLSSFDCWPQVIIPRQVKDGKPRLFELRVYESPTEEFGRLKVEMFNSGEVPIFLDCGIAPVFMGHALVGDKMPNLTYMTVYDSSPKREAAWKKFMDHPDWHQLRDVEKYQGTVSKIHKSDWVPKPYSQL